jgi:regulator of nonsense transcripts 3
MSASTTTAPAPAAPLAASKSKKREKKAQAAAPVDRLKVIVRRLPPNLPEEVFWQSVLPWVTDETASWRVFHPGKTRKRWAP